MKYLGWSVGNGKENMKKDSLLLDTAISENETDLLFRLYGWKPMCISLGRNQKENFVPNGIDCVRRLTGGRALLHDNEITYCCVVSANSIPDGSSVISSYKYISSILIRFFLSLGIELTYGSDKSFSAKHDYCMLLSTNADLCYKNKKIIGSAQYRKNGYILQHGSILYDCDKELLKNLFKEEITGITTVKEILPSFDKTTFLNKFEKFLENEQY